MATNCHFDWRHRSWLRALYSWALYSWALCSWALWQAFRQRWSTYNSQVLAVAIALVTVVGCSGPASKSPSVTLQLRDVGSVGELANALERAGQSFSSTKVGEIQSIRCQTMQLTDDDLQVICRLVGKQLTSLSLSGAAITDDAAQHLAGCANLQSLDLSNTRVGDGLVKAVISLPLKSLNLSDTLITDASLSTLWAMPELVELNVAGSRVRLLEEPVKVSPSLRHLDVSRCRLADRSLVVFGRMSQLKVLRLANNRLTAAALRELTERLKQAKLFTGPAETQNLVMAKSPGGSGRTEQTRPKSPSTAAAGSAVSQASSAGPTDLQQLSDRLQAELFPWDAPDDIQQLQLLPERPSFGDLARDTLAAVQEVAGRTGRVRLDWDAAGRPEVHLSLPIGGEPDFPSQLIADSALSGWLVSFDAPCYALRDFSTERLFAHLERCPALRYLNLSGTEFAAVALRLSRFQQLRTLKLDGVNAEQIVLAALKDPQAVFQWRELTLNETNVTAATVARLLPRCPRLERVELMGTAVTLADSAAWSQKFPRLDVRVDRPGQ